MDITSFNPWTRAVRIVVSVVCCVGGASLLAESLSAQDTLEIPIHRVESYERYRTASACLSAAQREERLFWRARRPDTAGLAQQEQWTPAAIEAGRRCLAVLTVDSISVLELLPLIELALIINDTALVTRAAEQYVRNVSPEQRAWAYYRIVNAILSARSVSFELGRLWLERLDGLGASATSERIRSYAKWTRQAYMHYDTAHMRLGIERGLALIRSATGDTWIQWSEEFSSLHYFGSRIAMGGPGGASEAIALLERAIEKLENVKPDEAAGLKAAISWYAKYGNPAERIPGVRWANVAPGDTIRPVVGQYSLIILVSHMCNEMCYTSYGSIKRLLQPFSGSNVLKRTLVTRAYGMFRLRGAPMSLDDEFNNVRTQYLETIGIPAELVVVEAPLTPLADGRLVQVTSGTEQHYGQGRGVSFPFGVLVDPDGNIQIMEYMNPHTERMWLAALRDIQ